MLKVEQIAERVPMILSSDLMVYILIYSLSTYNVLCID